jgi:hypothetical protein
MYGTVTVLSAHDRPHRDALGRAIETLVDELSAVPELVGTHVFATAPEQLVLVTLYADEAAAEALSQRARPRLAALVGSHVAGPPQRLAGPAILTRTGPASPEDG